MRPGQGPSRPWGAARAVVLLLVVAQAVEDAHEEEEPDP